jgi:hypothetical protein
VAGASLVVKEHREEGTVQLKVLKAYANACGGTGVVWALVFLWVAAQALARSGQYWITVWTEGYLGEGYGVMFYLAIYVSFTVAQSIVEFLGTLYFTLRWDSQCICRRTFAELSQNFPRTFTELSQHSRSIFAAFSA